MTKPLQPVVIAALLVSGCLPHANLSNGRYVERCAIRGAPTALMKVGNAHDAGAKLLERRDLPNDDVWDGSGTPRDSRYRRYIEELDRGLVEKDPARILATNDTFNNRIVANHLLDWMKPASCLEKVLISEQHRRMNMFSSPTSCHLCAPFA